MLYTILLFTKHILDLNVNVDLKFGINWLRLFHAL